MTNSTTKAAIWAERIQSWEASGLTQRAFCEREAIKYTTFDYWHRQVATKVAKIKPALKPAGRPLKLVPVQISSEQRADAIVLRSPAGWELHLASSVEPAWLAAILRSLP
jgi:hypothetical protein